MAFDALLYKHLAVPREISPQLDTLRGLSAIVVMVGHANQILVPTIDPRIFAMFGLAAQAAVMVFFLLSGFLICKSITRICRDHGEFSPAVYAVDRINRVVPPFLFSVLLVLTLWWLAPLFFESGTRGFGPSWPFAARSEFALDAGSVIGTLLFLNGFAANTISANGPLWSLSFEVWYYVAAAMIASFRGLRGFALAALLMLVLGALNHQFLAFALVWFGGAAVAVAHNWRLVRPRLAKLMAGILFFGAFVAGGLFVAAATSIKTPQQLDFDLLLLYQLLVGVAFTALLHSIVTGHIALPPVASSTARFSYTLYIIHFPIMLFVFGVTQHIVRGRVFPALACAVGTCVGVLFLAKMLASKVENIRPIKRRALA